MLLTPLGASETVSVADLFSSSDAAATLLVSLQTLLQSGPEAAVSLSVVSVSSGLLTELSVSVLSEWDTPLPFSTGAA